MGSSKADIARRRLAVVGMRAVVADMEVEADAEFIGGYMLHTAELTSAKIAEGIRQLGIECGERFTSERLKRAFGAIGTDILYRQKPDESVEFMRSSEMPGEERKAWRPVAELAPKVIEALEKA